MCVLCVHSQVIAISLLLPNAANLCQIHFFSRVHSIWHCLERDHVAFYFIFVCECYAFLAIVLSTSSKKVSMKHGTQWFLGEKWWKIEGVTGKEKWFSFDVVWIFSCVFRNIGRVPIASWPQFLFQNLATFKLEVLIWLLWNTLHRARGTVQSFSSCQNHFLVPNKNLKKNSSVLIPMSITANSKHKLMWRMKFDGNLFSFVELLEINCCLSCSITREKGEKKNGRHERNCDINEQV